MKRYPLALAFAVGLVLLAAASQCPADLPSDMEAVIAKSQAVTSLRADFDALKKHVVAKENGQPCPCGPNCPCCAACPGKQASTATSGTVVQHADGSMWLRTCDANGCRETPWQPTVASPYGSTVPCATCRGGVMYVQSGAAPFGVFGDGGGCASGNCGGSSGGSCASGNCGSSGGRGRGLFHRRR